MTLRAAGGMLTLERVAVADPRSWTRLTQLQSTSVPVATQGDTSLRTSAPAQVTTPAGARYLVVRSPLGSLWTLGHASEAGEHLGFGAMFKVTPGEATLTTSLRGASHWGAGISLALVGAGLGGLLEPIARRRRWRRGASSLSPADG